MKPPIPPPVPEPEELRVFTGKVAWDAQELCYRLDYSTPLKARLRGEIMGCKYNPAQIVALIFLPLIALFLVATQYLRTKPRLVSTCLHDWGVRDISPEITTSIEWSNLARIIENQGDIFLVGNMGTAGCYIARECFADQAESQRFYEIAQRLWQTNKRG